MRGVFKTVRHGYTIVELMVTVVIVSVLAATIGMFVVNLLTIQEQEREEAYIREKLTDICATYADLLSLGTNISISAYSNGLPSKHNVFYRHETGGVSLETGGRFSSTTGRVSRAAQLNLSMIKNNYDPNVPIVMGLDVQAFEQANENSISKFSRILHGDDTPLMHLQSMKELRVSGNNRIDLSYELKPLIMSTGDNALWLLKVMALYKVTYAKGRAENKTLTAERIVRLWNRQ